MQRNDTSQINFEQILKIIEHSEQILNITESSEQILNITENSEQILNMMLYTILKYRKEKKVLINPFFS
jgi:hypothetical protein